MVRAKRFMVVIAPTTLQTAIDRKLSPAYDGFGSVEEAKRFIYNELGEVYYLGGTKSSYLYARLRWRKFRLVERFQTNGDWRTRRVVEILEVL